VSAAEDAFCRLAIAMGFLAEEEAAITLAMQERLDRPERIGKLLIARGLLTPGQVQEVLGAQGRERGRPPEPEAASLLEAAARARAFGQLVLLRGLATEGELEECIFQQRQLANRGEDVRLGELLVQKGYLKASEVKDLLDLQARAEKAAEAERIDAGEDEAGA
jgi:hypothetical protein